MLSCKSMILITPLTLPHRYQSLVLAHSSGLIYVQVLMDSTLARVANFSKPYRMVLPQILGIGLCKLGDSSIILGLS